MSTVIEGPERNHKTHAEPDHQDLSQLSGRLSSFDVDVELDESLSSDSTRTALSACEPAAHSLPLVRLLARDGVSPFVNNGVNYK